MPLAFRLSSTWFDGRSPQARPCSLRLEADDLVMDTDLGERRYHVAQVRRTERSTHGQRQAHLPDGALIQHTDAAEWDAWWRDNGWQEARVVGWMQSWRATVAFTAATLLVLAAAWLWGVPALSQVLVHAVPPTLETRLGQQALQHFERLYLKPTRLSAHERDDLQRRFEALVERGYPGRDAPTWTLSFHAAPRLGANAFALPGGHIVLTDDLVRRLRDEPDAILGVLAHEIGHVHHRDGLGMLFRSSLVSGIVGVVIGDLGGVLAALPAVLATQAYLRGAERRADEHAARLLSRSGIRPAVMVVFFERMRSAGATGGMVLPIAVGSHPHDEERIRFFREWSATP